MTVTRFSCLPRKKDHCKCLQWNSYVKSAEFEWFKGIWNLGHPLRDPQETSGIRELNKQAAQVRTFWTDSLYNICVFWTNDVYKVIWTDTCIRSGFCVRTAHGQALWTDILFMVVPFFQEAVCRIASTERHTYVQSQAFWTGTVYKVFWTGSL